MPSTLEGSSNGSRNRFSRVTINKLDRGRTATIKKTEAEMIVSSFQARLHLVNINATPIKINAGIIFPGSAKSQKIADAQAYMKCLQKRH